MLPKIWQILQKDDINLTVQVDELPKNSIQNKTEAGQALLLGYNKNDKVGPGMKRKI